MPVVRGRSTSGLRLLGGSAQLTMVTHPLARSRLALALEAIERHEHVRAPPRAISVINEEFV